MTAQERAAWEAVGFLRGVLLQKFIPEPMATRAWEIIKRTEDQIEKSISGAITTNEGEKNDRQQSTQV